MMAVKRWMRVFCLSIFLLGACQMTVQAAGFQRSSVCSKSPLFRRYGCSFRRIKLAAKRGNTDAQYALGYLYYYGIGVGRNKRVGKWWIARAATKGHSQAIQVSKMLRIRVTPVFRRRKVLKKRYSSKAPYSRVNVDKANSRTPQKSLTEHLPRYNEKNSSLQE